MPKQATGQVRPNKAHGCYETRLRYKDGKRLWVLLPKGLSLLQAQAKSRVLAKLAKVTPSPPPRARALAQPGVETVDEYFTRWCANRRRSGILTVYDDECRYRAHVSPLIGGKSIAAITREEIEDVKDALNAKALAGFYVDGKGRRRSFKEKAAQNTWMVVKSMFKSASPDGEVRALRVRGHNVSAGIPATSKPARKRKQFLYPSELMTLANCEVIPLHWRRAYAISTYAYLRAGELEALTWADVDLEHANISVNKARQSDGTMGAPKNGEARSVPIEDTLAPLLVAMRAEALDAAATKGLSRREAEAAIASQPVVPMPQRNNRSEILRDDLKRSGVMRGDLFSRDVTRTPMTFHDLRATGITWRAVRGDPPFAVQDDAGHKSVVTTEKYVRAARKIRRGFGEPFPPLPASILQLRSGNRSGTNPTPKG